MPWVNPIWGSIFGLGFQIWDGLFGVPDFGNLGALYFVFSAVIWPLAVATLLAIALDQRLKRRKAFVILIALSFFVFVPYQAVRQLPIYLSFFP